MRKLIAFLEIGYVGMSGVDTFVVHDHTTEKEINELVWEMACQHAESYGYSPPSYDLDNDEYTSEDIEGSYEEYDPDKHDMLRGGGGSFEDDFKGLTP